MTIKYCRFQILSQYGEIERTRKKNMLFNIPFNDLRSILKNN